MVKIMIRPDFHALFTPPHGSISEYAAEPGATSDASGWTSHLGSRTNDLGPDALVVALMVEK
jgi:hypothetical protein